MIMKQITITSEYINTRLDIFLANYLNISRSFVQSLIKEGNVLVNNKNVSNSYKLKLDDVVSYEIIEQVQDFKPKDMDLDIVYEDDDIVIINKKQGVVVHPASGHDDDTLVNGLKYLYDNNLSNVNGEYRLGIVHRIDKDTSGLLCVAKNNKTHNFLADQLKDHTMNREYIALVEGTILEDESIIDLPLARSKSNPLKVEVSAKGKVATTYIKVIKRYEKFTLISCKLKTGRTHQIRVHLAYIGHPVVGDKLYNKSPLKLYDKGQLLHAYKLSFIHPKTKKLVSFESQIPDYFNKVLSSLK